MEQLKEEAFILWRNRPSILVGRNQNTLSEIHMDYVKEKGIDVVRRRSGGGTVFCDLGNLNFTFITRKKKCSEETVKQGELTSCSGGFEKFARPVISALQSLGVPAQFSGRNDILVNDMKVSGNAQYHEGDWLLHHGTLLYSGNMQELVGALKSKPLKFIDKSVKSVASRVTNISDHMATQMDVLAFRDYLKAYIMKENKIEKVYELTEKDFIEIEKIQKEKFESYEWNYGKSPSYAFYNEARFKAGTFEFHAQVKAGQIKALEINGDYFGERDMSELCEQLVGTRFEEQALFEKLEEVDLNTYAQNLSLAAFVSGILGLQEDKNSMDQAYVLPAAKPNTKGPKPEWLRVKLQGGKETQKVKVLLSELSLNTVCQEANCPNQMECYNKGTATFMILGRNCTRNCTFCNVTRLAPDPVDENEPEKVAEAVAKLGLKHAVITSVTRDDLEDQGASQFAAVVRAIRKKTSNVIIELLIPDLQGRKDLLDIILRSEPDILNHNVETVPELYGKVRPMANFERSLSVLAYSKEKAPHLKTKSGIMLGLGETPEQVKVALLALRKVNCDILTLGQYLQPSPQHIDVVEYVHPNQFEAYKEMALAMGFKSVASSPLVRSSYHAEQMNF
jgi:lipoic acid synthetase